LRPERLEAPPPFAVGAHALVFRWTNGETTMVLKELLTSDAGLMSLGVIVFMLGMAAFMYVRFRAYIREDSKTPR
jgi:hypothetical protein